MGTFAPLSICSKNDFLYRGTYRPRKYVHSGAQREITKKLRGKLYYIKLVIISAFICIILK